MVDSEFRKYKLVDADLLHAGIDPDGVERDEFVYVAESAHELATERPDIPDLARTIARAAAGDAGYFTTRELRLFGEHMSLSAVLFIHNELVAAGEPYVILESAHNTSSLIDKTALLAEQAEAISRGLGTEPDQKTEPLRTVTLTLPELKNPADGSIEDLPRHVLFSSPSSTELVRPEHRRRIAMHFGRSTSQLAINSPDYDTYARLFMKPGVVSPFISLDDTDRNILGLTDGLSAVYYSPNIGSSAEVAITAFDSIVMPGRALDRIVRKRGRMMNAESGWRKFRAIPA
jgi:hypothetical protein